MVTPKFVAKIESEDPTLRLAVLIDADNAQASVIEALLAEIARYGEATVYEFMEILLSPLAHLGKKYSNNTPLSQCNSLHTQLVKMQQTAL